jgi:hypothetical protein
MSDEGQRSGGELEELARAARAVVQAAARTVARGVMVVPDWQIARLREALAAFEAEL